MVMERHAWKGRREQQPPAALIPDGPVFENSWWISEESSDLGNSLVARPRTVGVEFRRGPFIAGRGVGWLGIFELDDRDTLFHFTPTYPVGSLKTPDGSNTRSSLRVWRSGERMEEGWIDGWMDGWKEEGRKVAKR
ncbi:hypothetical protein HZH66_000560 [Vespula vulgaris]|uniref:Uncharacterized protein n=1 Tax=Vespula vulgaris TaxID=7454 RepID=A0A834NKZ2_VESVU|nr:hypothetical protein HZH66_000560 [Vespula vulgaris]